MLDKEKAINSARIIADEYYQEWVEYLKKILKKTRQNNFKDPIEIIATQKVLRDQLERAQEAIKLGKKKLFELRSSFPDSQEIEGYERQIFINRSISRIVRNIADGIAWRVLDYDRPFLRMMAEVKKDPNSVDFQSYAKLSYDYALQVISQRGSTVLLNDITNFLRVGDVTEVGKITIVSELKYKTKKKKAGGQESI